MTDSLQAKLKKLPNAPGVYFHKDAAGEIIYVGKAAVLKNRVRQYFQSKKDFDAKTLALVAEIADTDWVETESEVDALFLESEMVKRYMPRWNILLRDDKSHDYIRIDMKSVWPHVTFTRNPADDDAMYFGPYYSGYAIKKAMRYLRRVFPYYTKPPKPGQADLDVHLGLSPGAGMTSAEYKNNLKKLIAYITGGRKAIVRELEHDMRQAAKNQQFELAAIYRNRLGYLRELQRRIVFGDKEFLDISKDRALQDLKELLCLDKEPARIEGFDISHMGGTNVVASMVVFINGASDRAEYRKFKMLRQLNDDTGNMFDTITRRMSEKNIKAWGLPDLLLIDGGKGQLDAAISALEQQGIAIPIVSMAKRDEELIINSTRSGVTTNYIEQLLTAPQAGVFVAKTAHHYVVNLHPGRANAGSHSRNLRGADAQSARYDHVLKLFQRIRDESHRFAVSYHTQLKRSGQTKSTLDDIPGVGPVTRKKLIKAFGSLRGIKQASREELAAIAGKKADVIIRYLAE